MSRGCNFPQLKYEKEEKSLPQQHKYHNQNGYDLQNEKKIWYFSSYQSHTETLSQC